MPADRLEWQPTPDRGHSVVWRCTWRSCQAWGVVLVDQAEFDLDERKQWIDQADRSTTCWRCTMPTSAWRVELSRAGPTRAAGAVDPAPRRHGDLHRARLIALRTLLLQHATHHRGQLSVYLRLLDVPLPPLVRADGDEPF
jgi:uncharacterized damage-inducible protein DinB